MGVTSLWPILDDLCERKPLNCLSGKKVAVDLSGWVVQALQCKGLQTTQNPHLRNLIFRVSHLLKIRTFPIFVLEGKVPELKENTVRERITLHHPESKSNGTRTMFDRILKQCQDLLECIGVPCIKSLGEGEHLCAFLCLKGIVDGVITEDNDAFLYGADVVFRNFSITDPHVDVYCLKSLKNKLNLDQRKLVALALLLGCDYSKKGLPGIGKETVLKLLSEMKCDILERFEEWKNLPESELFPNINLNLKKIAHCSRCEHPGSFAKHKKEGCPGCDSQFTCYLPLQPCSCQWHVNAKLMENCKTELKVYNIAKNCSDFPNKKVIKEYMHYDGSLPSNESLLWKCPNLTLFQERAFNYLNWTMETINEKFFHIFISWQLYQLNSASGDIDNFIYAPTKIVKCRKERDISYYEVKWKVIDDDSSSDENLMTSKSDCDYFSKCYPDIVTDFLNAQAELKERKQPKSKAKRTKEAEGNTKVQSEPVLCDPSNSPHSPDPFIPKESPPLDSFDDLLGVQTEPAFCDPSGPPCSFNSSIPKQSPFRDSFDSLLDVPLWERVKSIPKLLFQKYNSPITKSEINNKENISVFFDKESNSCSILSPVSAYPSHFSFEKEAIESIGNISKLTNYKKETNITPINCPSSIANHTGDYKRDICFNFSDTDDSFLNEIKSSNEKSLYNTSFQPTNIRIKETDTHSTPNQPLTKLINYSVSVENLYHHQSAISPLTNMTNSSPCLLYAANSTPLVLEQKRFLNCLYSEVFDNSNSPVLNDEILSKNSYLSTPKASKAVSSLVYSPLIFDSSVDVSL